LDGASVARDAGDETWPHETPAIGHRVVECEHLHRRGAGLIADAHPGQAHAAPTFFARAAQHGNGLARDPHAERFMQTHALQPFHKTARLLLIGTVHGYADASVGRELESTLHGDPAIAALVRVLHDAIMEPDLAAF